jgi:uncharacterized protein YjbJ (UPF0337 family)
LSPTSQCPHRWIGHREGMANDRAAEAREGLKDNMVGKAKELAGAVTGRDDLVEEGQLQQEEAKHRKQAVADEAIADAKREEATDELVDVNREANEQERDARARADREKAAAEQKLAGEQAAADDAAKRQEAAAEPIAEAQGDAVAETRLREAERLEDDADRTEHDAAAESTRLEREAAADQQRAAELRAQTEK